MHPLRAARLCILATLLAALLAPAAPAAAAPAFSVDDRGVFVVFPDRISFNAHIRGGEAVRQVVLEYGVAKRTCGDIVARAYPAFTPGPAIDVSWTWEMGATGSEPPGAVIWYRWRVTDAAGATVVTPEQRVTWLDGTHSWQSLSEGDLTLHWYAGDQAFAADLLNTMVAGAGQLAGLTGVRPQAPIHLYVYGDTQTMKDAVLYEPSWTGGLAYPANNITIIGISPRNLDWGKRAIVHELTHLIVGQLTFSCGENVPTWLDEGIAVFAEGGLDAYAQLRLDLAVATGELLSVRSLSSGFSAHPDLADLAYAQSYSLVRYLVERYGQARLMALFGHLRAGLSVEAGVRAAYGIGLDELEGAWRASLGAPPAAQPPQPAPPDPTPIPTYAPLAAAPTSPVPTPTALPTATAPPATPTPAPPAAAAPSSPAPAAAPAPNRAPRLLAALIVFLTGLALTGVAAWKLLPQRGRTARSGKGW